MGAFARQTPYSPEHRKHEQDQEECRSNGTWYACDPRRAVPDPSTGAIMMPIYATSTYVQESPGVHKGYEYSRIQNPTRMAYERCVADLEGGRAGFRVCLRSGGGEQPCSTCSIRGSHVIAMDDLYGGTYRLFERVRRRSAGLDFSFSISMTTAALKAALKPNTRMIWAETPTNPMLKLVDLAKLGEFARKHGSDPRRRQYVLLADAAAAARIRRRPGRCIRRPSI